MLKLRLTTFSLALGLLTACGGAGSTASTAEDDLVGEAAAHLVTADIVEIGEAESDEPAAAGADDAELDGLAEESADDLTTEPEAPVACDFGAARSRVRQSFDADQDGRLDPAERATLIADLADVAKGRRLGGLARRARHHHFARIRWAFDADGNRVLDEAERAELVVAMESRCELHQARMLERYDSNGDGVLDDAERLAGREARRLERKAKAEAFVARHDTDGDGQLSREERKAGRREELGAKRDALRARFDADGNGQLDEAEKAELKAAVRDRVANGRAMSEG